MKFLKSYKVFESSNDEHIRVIRDFLTDLSDDDVVVKVTDLNQYSFHDSIKKISILIGDDNEEDEYIVTPGKIDISKYIETLELVDKYLTNEGYVIESGHFIYTDNNGNESSFYKNNFIEIKEKLHHTHRLKICEIVYKDLELKETIKVPIEIGDTVLGGRFKNKKVVVKKIGKNKKGDITINDKPLLKFRLVKENLQEDVDYYLRHLEDDNFLIQVSDDYFRIFKPINGTVYSYTNCNPFQWSEIAGELERYISELEGKSVDYCYVVEKVGMVASRTTRTIIPSHSLLDQTFDCGEILSFTIGFK